MSAPRTATPNKSRLLTRLRTALHADSRLGLALRVTLWGLAVAYFAFALLLLALRYAILPQIENYRGDVEQMLGAAINRPVGIRKIEAHWAGMRPALNLEGFEIRDTEGRPALGFENVEAELSWSSLWHFELRLARLELDSPKLQLRRDKAGRFFAAGLEITPQAGDEEGFSDWLLLQNRVIIRDASIAWHDELRDAPPLELNHLNFQLENRGSRHRFGFTADPPRQLAARIDIRGDFKGRDLDRLEAWKGEVYAELDYADLAGWRQWVDYPVDLPQGSGALRLWLGFAEKQLSSVTADVRLADVRLRLRPDLPELDLLRLEGRLAGQRLDGGFKAKLNRLTLATRDDLVLQPTDLELTWLAANAIRPQQGAASANGLDLAALSRLAGYLPLDDATRARLARHAPRGRVFDLKLDWKGSAKDPAALASWSLKSRYEGLGLSALGPMPGISGINGRVEGNEKGGSLMVNGQLAAVELPSVFAEPKLELEALAAEIGWKSSTEGLLVNFYKVTFQNQDAAGDASGIWRALPQGPGQLELDGRLTRGNGQAVWRYMPLAVGKGVRDWLQTSVVGGTASEVTLKLHGDLAKFPFRGGKDGAFEVRGKFKDATLRYADSWPEINAIEGELLFAGERMLITGNSGKIFGVTLRNVHAEIADIEQHEELLVVSGKAAGPTADFLRFIEASPVGERIDHFTEEMQAEGRGELDLKLRLPLRKLDDSKVDGSYRFDGNRLTVDKDLPPLAEVRGGLSFSSDHLQARGIRGTLLEMPLSVDVKTAGDGGVQVNAAGELSIPTLRRQFPHAVFDHLSGATKWSSTIRAKRKTAEVKLTSNLLGISSSLPPPFNKSASETMAFSFERKPSATASAPSGRGDTSAAPQARPDPRGEALAGKVPASRASAQDMLDIRLGRALQVQLMRRHDSAPPLITRGIVAVGEASPGLPDRNLAVAINLTYLDADFWRKLLADSNNGNGQGKTPAFQWPTLQFDLRAAELVLLEKNFHDVRVKGSRPERTSNTRFELKSRELDGNFEWNSAGSGKLSGRIAQFSIPESVATPAVLQTTAREVIDEIPALDITVEQLSFKNRPLGTVRIAAENLGGYWNTQIDAKNEDGTLEATGRWRPGLAQPDTRVDFKLGAKSIEKLLARIGYPDTIRRGNAKLAGNLSWSGSPFKIDFASLDGNLSLDAAGGQFVKLEPGVGRLLGILSLQSLPRRITLDFRDIFSEGFAFDSIGGQFTVARGEMETKELKITGPSAKVLMSGTVNLASETQNLKVRVQPAVGESIAVGAMIANPVAGAVVWAAQKLFKDPLDQAFAFEYGVTGSWADPKVEKLGQAPKVPAENAK
ncbi:MAG: TIGR02099 family protein [Burkholderiaceae bacterium]|nr:TIGR02099 family protein [Sulfuritalea sp.]MCF8174441.1 TIGR02099 family protein [Burkholderiaceae bacterium]MCF8183772.1 TIGR02099 family protein [Polynucleobacter sp.]